MLVGDNNLQIYFACPNLEENSCLDCTANPLLHVRDSRVHDIKTLGLLYRSFGLASVWIQWTLNASSVSACNQIGPGFPPPSIA